MLAVRPLAAPRPLCARAAVRGGAPVAQRAPAKPCAARRASLVVRADAAATSSFAPLLLGIEDAFFGSPLKLAGTAAISFVTFRLILYFKLQGILAQHLGNNVPLGSRVVHYGIKNGLHLNYYRTGGVKSVHGVDPAADEGMLFNVGGQAGIPVTPQKAGYGERLRLEANSMDACVSIDAIGQQGSASAVDISLAEAARVLRPGASFVFFEHGSGGEALIEGLKRSAAFDRVDYDAQWATYGLAKHSIGLAFRTGTAVAGAAGAAASGRAAATASFASQVAQAKVQAALGKKITAMDEEEDETEQAKPAGDDAPDAPATPAAPPAAPQPRRQAGKRRNERRR